MVHIPEKTITLEEFLKQPETKPAREYLNGQTLLENNPPRNQKLRWKPFQHSPTWKALISQVHWECTKNMRLLWQKSLNPSCRKAD